MKVREKPVIPARHAPQWCVAWAVLVLGMVTDDPDWPCPNPRFCGDATVPAWTPWVAVGGVVLILAIVFLRARAVPEYDHEVGGVGMSVPNLAANVVVASVLCLIVLAVAVFYDVTIAVGLVLMVWLLMAAVVESVLLRRGVPQRRAFVRGHVLGSGLASCALVGLAGFAGTLVGAGPLAHGVLLAGCVLVAVMAACINRGSGAA